jgi:hypothetical protein
MEAIVNKTIVGLFYRQHAGFFLVLFIVSFGIVAPSQQLAYHYALIRGMLEAPVFLLVVGFAWLLYAGKVVQFVLRVMDSPEGLFLARLRALDGIRCYWLLLRVQHRLFLPVSGYALAIIGVAVYRGARVTAVVVGLYVLSVCGLAAGLFYSRLASPGMARRRGFWGAGRLWPRWPRFRNAIRPWPRFRHVPYWSVQLRFLLDDNKWISGGIKVFSCMLLFLLLRQQTADKYDLRLLYFCYSVALFGHGILLFRCGRLEMSRITYYRALPVSLLNRFGQYCLFLLLLLLPEFILLAWLAPSLIRTADAWQLAVTGYSLLLLLSSCLWVIPLRVTDFLKLWLVLFGIWYACVLGGFLITMSGSFAGTAVLLFWRGYYRCEIR